MALPRPDLPAPSSPISVDREPGGVPDVPRHETFRVPSLKTEYCPACLHAFLAADIHGTLLTHHVNAEGNTTCVLCTPARPCQGTVVAGRSGYRFKGPMGLGEPPKKRVLPDYMTR
jgi:hypothetical protein